MMNNVECTDSLPSDMDILHLDVPSFVQELRKECDALFTCPAVTFVVKTFENANVQSIDVDIFR